MLTYLRKIRRSLIESDAAGKYILYATGEITLVVIGILIALQINNWNESRKEIKNENEIITSLQKEITVNIEQLELVKTKNDQIANDGTNIIQKLTQGIDTISSSEMSRAFNYFPSIVKSPVLDYIVASNSNVLVKKKGLITDFRILKDKYDDIAKQEFYLDEFWNTKVVDFFVSCGFAFRESLDDETLISIREIELGGYSKKQFIALIKMKGDLQKYWEDRRKVALDKSKEVLELLERTPN